MISFLRKASCLVLLFSLPTTADAQAIPKERLTDWQFRFYACKHVVMNATIVVRLMAKYQVSDQGGIDNMQTQLGPALVKAVTENEKEYTFSKGEAWFVSDLTFAVVSGMVSGGFDLTDLQLIQSGSEICIHTIDSMAE